MYLFRERKINHRLYFQRILEKHQTIHKVKTAILTNEVIAVFLCDPGAIQTHDLQNRNLTTNTAVYTMNKHFNILLTPFP